MMEKGYYFNIGQKEFFVITNRERKTDKFLTMVCKAVFGVDKWKNATEEERTNTKKQLDYKMIPAFYELKTFTYKGENLHDIKHGQTVTYEDIHGKNFSGYGSDNIEKKKTTLIYA